MDDTLNHEDESTNFSNAESADETRQTETVRDAVEYGRQAQREQLDALRVDVMRLRTEVMAIAAGTSKLAALEASLAIETVENGIRRHLAPVLFAAGAAGFVWSAFLRRR
ncbi:hypothetical protein LAC81_36810 (plasmid) [Ensifer adhaerens]|uniref:hypothetical protein n=1 Tax=Ensifer adhaerens TaxID=106592 RepID=UPI001CC10AC1|nr:hypothetical protein [Ensifer adhaerens]MBZ7927500.1 hypothetical protein [Ensifer adhaerens]UAX97922.1 hypothetical protein LAC78_38115 [Ensifer adhaerens]UAY05301.1 hypothetical protein LAC80_36825 [Ensifer adhaerens]UAY12679.1 hypothetical protein LAC81_36810 [Ensifer adhaerens]